MIGEPERRTREVYALFSHGVVSSLFNLHDNQWKESLSHNTVQITSWSVPILTSQRQAKFLFSTWLQLNSSSLTGCIHFTVRKNSTSLYGTYQERLNTEFHKINHAYTHILRIVHIRLRITEINFINLITTIMTILY